MATYIADYIGKESRLDHQAETKSSSTDLVTAVDRRAEAMTIEAISEVRPDDGFVGEEGSSKAGTTGVDWVIDPIDGTTNFVHGHPGFCVSIAAEVSGRVVAGAVGDPSHGQVFDAAVGSGACCNGEVIQASHCGDIHRAVIATGFSYNPERRREQALALAEILPEVADIRRMGSAATDLCGVALGRVDAYYETGLNHWDLAAGALIASEAGATVQLPGTSHTDDDLIIASAPAIYSDLRVLIERSDLVSTHSR
ncbi:MAG: inositol monophosphatase family protein [Acidimicrobiales bacterium]